MEARTTPEAVVPFTSAQQPTLCTSTDGPSICLATCIVTRTYLFIKLELLQVESPNTSLHTIVKLYCLRTHDLLILPFNIIPATLEYTLIYIFSNKLMYRKKKINQFITTCEMHAYGSLVHPHSVLLQNYIMGISVRHNLSNQLSNSLYQGFMVTNIELIKTYQFQNNVVMIVEYSCIFINPMPDKILLL